MDRFHSASGRSLPVSSAETRQIDRETLRQQVREVSGESAAPVTVQLPETEAFRIDDERGSPSHEDLKASPRAPPTRRYLSYADLEQRYGKSRVTIWRWVRAGILPAPYNTGPNSRGFASDEIEERDAHLPRRDYGQAL